MKRPILSILVLSLVFLSSHAIAQWQMTGNGILGKGPIQDMPYLPYYGSEGIQSGAITYSNGIVWAAYRNVYMSLDSGRTWIDRTPSLPDTITSYGDTVRLFNDIRFYDRTHGFVIDMQGDVYITNDQGGTWRRIRLINSLGLNTGCYLRNSNEILICGDTATHYSSDGGSTFQIIDHGYLGTGYAIYLSSGILYRTAVRFATSINYGVSWRMPYTNLNPEYADMFAVDTCNTGVIYSPMYYDSTNKSSFLNSSALYKSIDTGKTWKLTLIKGLYYFSNSIVTTRTSVLCQTTIDQVIRSTDKGETWNSIGGPNGPIYSRALCALNDNIIFAGDTNGNVWVTYNAGGYPIDPREYNEPFVNLDTIDFHTVNGCINADSILAVINRGCDTLSITEVKWLQNSNFSYSHPSLPAIIPSGKSMPLSITYTPTTSDSNRARLRVTFRKNGILQSRVITIFGIGVAPSGVLSTDNSNIIFDSLTNCSQDSMRRFVLNTGCDTLLILGAALSSGKDYLIDTSAIKDILLPPDSTLNYDVLFSPTDLGTKHDTLIISAKSIHDSVIQIIKVVISGEVIPNLNSYSIQPSEITWPPTSVCYYRDSTTTITNTGCDSIQIADIKLQGNLDYMLTQNPNGIWLAPGASTTVSVRYSPSSSGIVQGSLFITLWEQGKLTTREVPLRGTGIEGDGIFTYEPKSFDFNTLSICSRDSGSGYVTNTGCDTLSLTDAKLFADADYTMSALPPIALVPEDTIRYQVYLSPQMKGVRRGYIVFSTTTRSGIRRDSIPLTVNVTDGTRILASSRNTLDFGTTTLCEERDSTVRLRNTGCDTLRVSGVGVQGIGFSSNVTTPIIIPPGDSITIPVTTNADTSQGNISTGTITFTSDADNQIEPITLSRGYTYPKTYSFHIAMLDGTATSGEIVRLAIVGEQGLGSAGSGVNQLDFDLSLNEDLLEYIRPEGSNTITKNGSLITISNPNELTSNNDTLAILIYHVYLTKDSATDINVSNMSLNNGNTSSCAPTIAAITQAGFTYRYECGDKHIQSFLRTGKASLEITSIRPNPAKDELTVDFMQNEKANVSFEVYDMLGTLITKSEASYLSGLQKETINLQSLPSGSYIISLRSPGGVTSKRFTKEK